MLYFSDRSWIGLKNRRAYWRKAAIVPTVMAPRKDSDPPYQMIKAIATAARISTVGKNSA